MKEVRVKKMMNDKTSFEREREREREREGLHFV